MWGAALLLLGLYLAPVLVSFCLPDPRGGVPWHQARRDPTGLSPDPAVTQEAVIQVFAAPAVSWRGIFSVHTWIAVKPTGAPRFTRYEVLGFGVANGAPAVRIDRMGPDNYWFGARPQILLDRRGAGVDEMIAQVRAAVASYPYPNSYRPWPGPNSNTFLAHIARQVPELAIQLPSNAVGKDFLPGGGLFAAAPSGSGFQVSLYGLCRHPARRSRGSRGEPAGPQSWRRPGQAGIEAAGTRQARDGAPIERRSPLSSGCCARKCCTISQPVARHTPACEQMYSSAASSAPIRCGWPVTKGCTAIAMTRGTRSF